MSTTIVENGINFHYVQDMLGKSVEFSKMLYEKTGFKNEFIETNAQKINVASSQFAHLLDIQIDATVNKVSETTKTLAQKTSETKQALLEKTSQTKKDLIQRTMNLSVVKKTEDLGNLIITELEQQVLLLTASINKKLSLPESSNTVVEEQQEQEGKLALTERSTRLLLTLNNLGLKIAEFYMNQAKSLTIVKSAQQKYEYVDLKTKHARACVESFCDVLFNTVIAQHLINPLFNSLQVKYTQSKETVSVVIENIKKVDVQNLLTQTQNTYESLKKATIVSLKDDKLSFTFAREFFKSSLETIQREITQLLTDVSALRARFVEQAVNLYNLSVQEFKTKRSAKLGLKAIVSPSTAEEEQSQSSLVQLKTEEEEQQQEKQQEQEQQEGSL